MIPAHLPPMIARRIPGKQPGQCEWFAACTNEAIGTVEHPVLDEVPCCQRCADKLDLDLTTYEERAEAEAADAADGYDPAEPWMDPT